MMAFVKVAVLLGALVHNIDATNVTMGNGTTAATTAPTTAPTSAPTTAPTGNPTAATNGTMATPTASPTAATASPTVAPTVSPTAAATTGTNGTMVTPTASPTTATASPTVAPTVSPTAAATAGTNGTVAATPTSSPTVAATAATPAPTATATTDATSTTVTTTKAEVTGKLLLSVENANEFIADPNVKIGVTNSIAEMADVPASSVNVTLLLTTARRLRGQDERRLATSVTADYTIVATSEAAANSLKSTLTAVSTTAIASTLATQLEAAGVNTTASYGGDPAVPQAMTAAVQISYPPTETPTVAPTTAPTLTTTSGTANTTTILSGGAPPNGDSSGVARAAQLLTPVLAVVTFLAMVGATA